MPALLIRKVRTKQPSVPTGIDQNNTIGNRVWNCVHVPTIMLFGNANPTVVSLGVNTAYGTSGHGRCVTQSGTGIPNSGLNYGANSGFNLSVSSGIIAGTRTDTNLCNLFRTGTLTVKNGDFYIDLNSAGNARLLKANVVEIIVSSNAAPLGSDFFLAWSYNNSTGRAVIALNGVVTTANSAQTFDHTGDAILTGYDQSTGTNTYPSKASLLALSPTEILNNEITRQASINPWQIFEPEVIPLFWSSNRVSNTSTASLSAAIAQRNTATASVSAVIKAGITTTASVNAAIQAPRSATASLSAAVMAGQSATASLSAAVRLAATATASLSAAVRVGQTATASISGAVQVSATATASLSASITAPGALSITASLSAAVRQANAATASIDSAIRAARTASASIDSAITAQRTASASASAAVSVAFSVSASLDSAVQRVAIASASLSAYVQADTTITQAEVDMLADIWRRLGLDIANPLVQGTTTLTFGPTITLSGSGTITSTRTGAPASGPAAGVMLSDVWQRLGLDPANPMTASDTAINAGAVSQTVSESAGTVTVQRA